MSSYPSQRTIRNKHSAEAKRTQPKGSAARFSGYKNGSAGAGSEAAAERLKALIAARRADLRFAGDQSALGAQVGNFLSALPEAGVDTVEDATRSGMKLVKQAYNNARYGTPQSRAYEEAQRQAILQRLSPEDQSRYAHASLSFLKGYYAHAYIKKHGYLQYLLHGTPLTPQVADTAKAVGNQGVRDVLGIAPGGSIAAEGLIGGPTAAKDELLQEYRANPGLATLNLLPLAHGATELLGDVSRGLRIGADTEDIGGGAVASDRLYGEGKGATKTAPGDHGFRAVPQGRGPDGKPRYAMLHKDSHYYLSDGKRNRLLFKSPEEGQSAAAGASPLGVPAKGEVKPGARPVKVAPKAEVKPGGEPTKPGSEVNQLPPNVGEGSKQPSGDRGKAGSYPNPTRQTPSEGEPTNPIVHVSSYPGSAAGKELNSLLLRHVRVLLNLGYDHPTRQIPILQMLGIQHNIMNPGAIASTGVWGVEPYLQIELPGASPETARGVGSLFGDAWQQDGVGLFGIGEPHYVARLMKPDGSQYMPREINTIASAAGRYNIGVDTNGNNTALEFHRYPFEEDDWGQRFSNAYGALRELGLVNGHQLTEGEDSSEYLSGDDYGQLRANIEGVGKASRLQDTEDVPRGGSSYEHARSTLSQAAEQAHESVYGPGSWPGSGGASGDGGQGVAPVPPPQPPATGQASGNTPGADSLPAGEPTQQASLPQGYVPAMLTQTPGLERLFGMTPARRQVLLGQFYGSGRNVG